MARTKQREQGEGLKQVLAAFPEGAALEQIERALSPSIPRRTLIRRLTSLVEAGEIEKSGISRAAKYSLPGLATPERVERTTRQPGSAPARGV